MAINRFKTFIAFASMILFVHRVIGAIHEPFSEGFSMGSQGAVLWSDGVQGAQPWNSAAFYRDTYRWGIGITGISYYDRMENFSDRFMYKVTGGGWYSCSHFTGKLSYSQMSILETYIEQKGFLSLGTDIVPFVNLSAELRGFRFGLRGSKDMFRTLGDIGFSAWIPWKYVSGSISAQHLVINGSGDESSDLPLIVSIGLHSSRHKYGAQGILIDITPDLDKPVRFTIGEQFWLSPQFSLQGSLASNPVLISFGATVCLTQSFYDLSFVNHPVLGWSQGFSALYKK